jgi:hypothetical protein
MGTIAELRHAQRIESQPEDCQLPSKARSASLHHRQQERASMIDSP